MEDKDRTKEQLINELVEMRRRCSKLEEAKTRHEKIEEELRENEERFKKLSDAAFEGIAITEMGSFLEVNKTFADMFGYTPSEVIGMHVSEFVAPSDRDFVIQKILSGYEKPYEAVCVRKDGDLFPVEVCGKSINYKGRKARVSAIRDITERKMAEKALKESEEKYHSLADNVDEVHYAVDTRTDIFKGKLIFVSEQIENIAGYRSEEFLNNPQLWFQLIHPDDIKSVEKSTREMITSKKKIVRNYRIRHKNTNEYRWLEDRVKPMTDKSGNVVRFLGVAYDITMHKKIENQLKERVEELEKFYGIAIDRELKIAQLNEEIKKLKSALSQYRK